MRQTQKWRFGVGWILAGFLCAGTANAAVAATERRDPLFLNACQLTIDGLEGNRPELRPGPIMLPSTITVEMPRVNNQVGPLQGFVMTVHLSPLPQVIPLFLMAHASAAHFSQATLQCLDAALHPMFQWVLSDVVLSVPKFPIEQISLMATKAQYEDLVAHVKFAWDAKVNQGGVMTPAGPLQYVAPTPVKPPLPGGGSSPTPLR